MLASGTGFFGIGTSVDECLRDGFHTFVSAVGQVFENSSPSTQQHEGFIHGDARQPGRKSRFFFKLIKVKENLVKRLLQNFFGILPVIRDPLRYSENSPLMTNKQSLECLSISALYCGYQETGGVLIQVRGTKVVHNSVPPRHLLKRRTTRNRAIAAPKNAWDRTDWEIAERIGDDRFSAFGAASACSAI